MAPLTSANRTQGNQTGADHCQRGGLRDLVVGLRGWGLPTQDRCRDQRNYENLTHYGSNRQGFDFAAAGGRIPKRRKS